MDKLNKDKLNNVAQRLGLISVVDMERYTALELMLMITNKVNELIVAAGKFETDMVNIVRVQNNQIQYLLDEGLHLEVLAIFDGWVEDGTFDMLINQVALKEINERIDETNNDLEVERARIDLLTKVENGESDGNAELLDIRIGANGKVYDTAGNNVRDVAKGIGILDRAVTPQKTTFINSYREIGLNKFNKEDILIKRGSYLANDGRTVSDTRTFVSHKIYVNGGDVVRITDDSITVTNPGLIFNAAGNAIYKITDYISRAGGVRGINLPKDNNISYIIFNCKLDLINEVMVTINHSLPGEYTPYSYSDYFELSDDITLKNHMENPLKNKTIITNGDSIMRGYGNSNIGFIDIIAERNEMKCTNYAVSGGTLAINTYQSDGKTPRHWISDDIKNMNPEADYVIFEGGFNDHSNGVATGVITNTYDDDFDKTTLLGALESICQQLYEKYPTAKKGFVFPHGLLSYDAYFNTEKIGLMKDVLKKWGINYIDLAEVVPPFGRIESLNQKFTYKGDKVHPNNDGYINFYCDPVESWIKTL